MKSKIGQNREGIEVKTIVIPGRPKGKGRPKFSTVHGRSFVQAYTPESTKEKEAQIRAAFINKYGSEKKDYCGPVEIEVMIIHKIPKNTPKKRIAEMELARPLKKPDIDNVVKLVLDALNGAAFKDDRQVISVKAEKIQREEPGTVISIFYGDNL